MTNDDKPTARRATRDPRPATPPIDGEGDRGERSGSDWRGGNRTDRGQRPGSVPTDVGVIFPSVRRDQGTPPSAWPSATDAPAWEPGHEEHQWATDRRPSDDPRASRVDISTDEYRMVPPPAPQPGIAYGTARPATYGTPIPSDSYVPTPTRRSRHINDVNQALADFDDRVRQLRYRLFPSDERGIRFGEVYLDEVNEVNRALEALLDMEEDITPPQQPPASRDQRQPRTNRTDDREPSRRDNRDAPRTSAPSRSSDDDRGTSATADEPLLRIVRRKISRALNGPDEK